MLLVDGEGRLLVLKGHDPHQVGRTWWFTPGGGVDPGEGQRDAAVRELAEETGWILEPHELTGPVWSRTALFDFMSRPYVQREVFFVGRLEDAERRGQVQAKWTEAERDTIDEVAWLSEAELRRSEIEVFPAELRQPWDAFLAWDGATADLGEVNE